MSRSVYTCRTCGLRLGSLHHGQVLTVERAHSVTFDPDGERGSSVRIVCPACFTRRDYRAGVVVMKQVAAGEVQHTG